MARSSLFARHCIFYYQSLQTVVLPFLQPFSPNNCVAFPATISCSKNNIYCICPPHSDRFHLYRSSRLIDLASFWSDVQFSSFILFECHDWCCSNLCFEVVNFLINLSKFVFFTGFSQMSDLT